MNPAVTLAMALRAKTSWLKVCNYYADNDGLIISYACVLLLFLYYVGDSLLDSSVPWCFFCICCSLWCLCW